MATNTSTEQIEFVEEWEVSENFCFACGEQVEFRLIWRVGQVAPDVETKCEECGWQVVEKSLL